MTPEDLSIHLIEVAAVAGLLLVTTAASALAYASRFDKEPQHTCRLYHFEVRIRCRHLDWQVSSTAQILDTLQPVLSVVEKLLLGREEHSQSSGWHNEVDCTLWRQLLRPFSNLKTLHVQDELLGKLAGSLQTDDGGPPLELLPNLEEVEYSVDNALGTHLPHSSTNDR
ncbi:hypothetical protein BJV78DRAFT_1362329 [Lactifluus subvellereus]|nr:hypothetical protein BJV78DRAFT_1362329 [Lactifluus subvellereus]